MEPVTTENFISNAEKIEHGSELMLKFNSDGLIAAVVQDHETGEILMLGYMNDKALHLTLETGKATFWSRSRQQLWTKGETSGNYLNVHEILIDCDQDAVVVKATMEGDSTCHTGAKSCFYRKINHVNNGIKLSKF